MAVKLKISKIANPQDRTKFKYYLTQEKSGVVTIREIGKEIVSRSSLTLGDVQNVISNFVEMIPFFLSFGQSIHIEGFGTFRLVINSSGEDAAKNLSRHNVIRKKIVFLPAPEVKRALEDLSFEIIHDENGTITPQPPAPPSPPSPGNE